MPDPAEQLQKIFLAGFELQSLERFPAAIGVVKGNCMVLLRATPMGLQRVGQPGWRMGNGDLLGVLVEKEGKRFFQNKLNVVEATAERLVELDVFRQEVENLLAPKA
jgi:hypothetical protein